VGTAGEKSLQYVPRIRMPNNYTDREKQKTWFTYIENLLVKNFGSPESMEHGLDWSITSKEVVRADVWVLREAMKALRNKCQGGGVDHFVEDQLKDFI
jgi:hypothetical protein